MSITTTEASVPPVVNATKSLITDVLLTKFESEEKDVEPETSLEVQVSDDPIEVSDDPTQDLEEVEQEQEITDKEEEDFDESVDTACTERSDDFDAENEDKFVNSDEFGTDFNYSVYHVLKVAQMDRKRILRNAKEIYKEETGDEASDEVIANAFRVVNIVKNEMESEDEYIVGVDPKELRKEFEEALCNVRAVAKLDQEILYDRICKTHYELCGKEPDTKQISEIFDRIKEEFAEEAKEDYEDYDSNQDDDDDDEDDEDEDDSNDEDYSPSNDEFDYSKDVDEDKFASESDESEDEEDDEEHNEEES